MINKQLKFKWPQMFMALIIFIGTFAFLGNRNVVNAASASVVYRGSVSYGGSIVGDFTVNGQQAFCIEHSKATTPTGSANDGGSIYDNKKIAAALYWGWGGTENIFSSDRSRGIVVTSLVLSRLNNGVNAGGNSISGYSELWDKAQAEDIPDASMSFSKTSVNSSVNGNVQQTETIKFNADSSNKISFSLPSSITFHNTSTSKNQTGGTVAISGGQSFYLTAPLDYGSNYSSGNLKGSMKSFLPIVYTMANPDLQKLSLGVNLDPTQTINFTAHFEKRISTLTINHVDKYTGTVLKTTTKTLVDNSSYSEAPYTPTLSVSGNTYVPLSTSSQTGNIGTSNKTITFYYALQRTITVIHKDNRDGTVLKQTTDTVKQGDTYSYSPLTTLKKGTYTYRPVSSSAQSGTVGRNNITLYFYYDVPLIKVSLQKLQIYTAAADKGLPVKINLSKTVIYTNSTTGMTTAAVSINLYQGTNKLVSNQYTAQSLPSNISMTIPSSSGLTKNTNKLYTVKVEGFNANDVDLDSTAASLATHGYTSTQATYNVDVSQTSTLSKTGVIMTEITPTTTEKKYNETFNYSFTKAPDMKTGYGYENNVSLSYTNDLANSLSVKNMTYSMPDKFLDTDNYLSYSTANGQANTSMIETDSTSTSGTQAKTTVSYKLPHVDVEKETGNLFSDQEVAAKDSRITKGVIDGGNKMYLPIWKLDLGTYPVSSTSNGVGVNLINVNGTDTVKVKAFMFAWMGSPTIEDDALLMVPVDPNHPNMSVLKGWTQSDLDWLKK